MSRTPDERLYSSGSHDSFAFTQCYVSFGDPDGEDFAFTKCDADGTFTLSGLPDGDWRITVFDQWNDMLVDGLSTPVRLAGGKLPWTWADLAMNQWQANIYTRTFFDENGDGVRRTNEAGLTLVPTNIRFRDGSFSNFNNTDLNGIAGFNEIFPLFSWYVIETDTTRYKNTGTHVVYDAGGPADGQLLRQPRLPVRKLRHRRLTWRTPSKQVPLPATCGCRARSIARTPTAPAPSMPIGRTRRHYRTRTGRIDPPWVVSEGWQGFSGQNYFIEFGKTPFAAGRERRNPWRVIYASTRPFDDPALLIHTSWEPLVPDVTINLYQEGTAPDGSQSAEAGRHHQDQQLR